MTAIANETIDTYATRVGDDPRSVAREDLVVWGSEGPLSRDQLTSFDSTGYLIFDQSVSGDEVEQFRDVHQNRVNFKPGYDGNEFYWHSDFETWHAEDGMPRMRAVSMSIALTDNYSFNVPLMIMPGSHKTYSCCAGQTPQDNYKSSLVAQEAGTPDRESLAELADRHGIDVLTGKAGGATLFDCNCMHGSNGNLTPHARSNVFVVFNSVDNACGEPFAAGSPRPPFIGARDFTPVR